MTWVRKGNIKGPPGPNGPIGPMGPQGSQGVVGPAGPGLSPGGSVGQLLVKSGASDFQTKWDNPNRDWYLAGDNSGDNVNSNNAIWSTVKSPVFTAEIPSWYRIHATFNMFVANNAVVAALAIMVDAAVARMLYFTGTANYYTLITLDHVVQLSPGQKVMIGYRPTVNGKVVTFVNSNTVVPILLVAEIDTPS